MNARKSVKKLLAIASVLGLGFTPSALAQVEAVMPDMEAADPAVESVAQAPGDIVAVASAIQEFSTLVTAVQAAELVEPLQGEGPFTVFAPTDAAFEALPDGVLEALLLPENQDLLTELLTYHVVPGELMSSELSTGTVDTLSGEPAMVTVEGGMVMIEDVDVIAADVQATNGVIHAVDEVLIPSGVATELESRLAAAEEEMMTEEPMVEEPMVEEPMVEEPMVEETAPAEPVRGLW